jgi:hypothetical protein
MNWIGLMHSEFQCRICEIVVLNPQCPYGNKFSSFIQILFYMVILDLSLFWIDVNAVNTFVKD